MGNKTIGQGDVDQLKILVKQFDEGCLEELPKGLNANVQIVEELGIPALTKETEAFEETTKSMMKTMQEVSEIVKSAIIEAQKFNDAIGF